MNPPSAVAPYLCCRDAVRAIDFYVQAFGAVELYRLVGPDGRLGHAELQLGPSRLMLGDEYPEQAFNSPLALGGTPVTLHLYVEDADAAAARAIAAGATLERPVEDQFYGDRGGSLRDPFGHRWWVSHRLETLGTDEIRARFEALYNPAETPGS